MSIKFCHIAPTATLPVFAQGRNNHLLLAHLVESDPAYANFYENLTKEERGLVILDNSAFEMYKQGRDMYPSNKLVEMAKIVKAQYVVMSDYPGEVWSKTRKAAEKMGPELHRAGYGTFYVPQSPIGDLAGLLDSWQWAAQSKDVDYIGMSILAVPNAYGVEKGNKLQRFFSRWKFFHELQNRGILHMIKENNKKVHILGMVDGPNEIALLSQFSNRIDSWDSSAAVWAGLNSIAFDDSPTGLVDGKFEKEVDFSASEFTLDQVGLALQNCAYIDSLSRGAHFKYV